MDRTFDRKCIGEAWTVRMNNCGSNGMCTYDVRMKNERSSTPAGLHLSTCLIPALLPLGLLTSETRYSVVVGVSTHAL